MKTPGFRRLAAVVIALTAALVFSAVFAEAHGFRGNREGAMLQHFLKGLDLTAAQKQQVGQILQSHRGDRLSGRIAVLQARQNLMKATTAAVFDANAVQAAYGGVATAQGNMALLRAKIFSEIWPVLTPDQQAILGAKMEKVSGRMQQKITRLESKLNTGGSSKP